MNSPSNSYYPLIENEFGDDAEFEQTILENDPEWIEWREERLYEERMAHGF